jgi:hypothetical protein
MCPPENRRWAHLRDGNRDGNDGTHRLVITTVSDRDQEQRLALTVCALLLISEPGGQNAQDGRHDDDRR